MGKRLPGEGRGLGDGWEVGTGKGWVCLGLGNWDFVGLIREVGRFAPPSEEECRSVAA